MRERSDTAQFGEYLSSGETCTVQTARLIAMEARTDSQSVRQEKQKQPVNKQSKETHRRTQRERPEQE